MPAGTFTVNLTEFLIVPFPSTICAYFPYYFTCSMTITTWSSCLHLSKYCCLYLSYLTSSSTYRTFFWLSSWFSACSFASITIFVSRYIYYFFCSLKMLLQRLCLSYILNLLLFWVQNLSLYCL